MQEEIAMQISQRLRDIRKEKKITLEELARRAQVSKSLVSQIENNRTIPSLLVLIGLIQSLGVNIHDFFNDIGSSSDDPKIILRRRQEYTKFSKEPAEGFTYQRIMSKSIAGQLVDFVLLELAPGADRPQLIKTDAYEFKYVVSGEIEYTVGREKLLLETGDSLFFDASQPHKPRNVGETTAVLLAIYFFHESAKS